MKFYKICNLKKKKLPFLKKVIFSQTPIIIFCHFSKNLTNFKKFLNYFQKSFISFNLNWIIDYEFLKMLFFFIIGLIFKMVYFNIYEYFMNVDFISILFLIFLLSIILFLNIFLQIRIFSQKKSYC
jgi:hypothetical protein